MKIVEALKNLYAAFGGNADDVKTTTNVADMINHISEVAGGSPLKMGIITGMTDSNGEIHISKENAPGDFKWESFVCVRKALVGLNSATAFARNITKFNNADNVTLVIHGSASDGFTSSTLQKNKEVTIEFWYVPNS